MKSPVLMSLMLLLLSHAVGLYNHPAFGANEILIAENGQARASIIVPLHPSEGESSAGRILQRYVLKATGAKLPIRSETTAPAGTEGRPANIFIGGTQFALGLDLRLDQLDEDGFQVIFPGQNQIVIVGPEDSGTEFGVYSFLEKFLGVKWLMPGNIWEHVPTANTLSVPAEGYSDSPKFFSRWMSGFRGECEKTWLRRSRLHNRISTRHNMYRLFPPSKYIKSHPEFFPIVNGKRYLPNAKPHENWQPCFSASGITREAIKNITDYFSVNPHASSFSMGLNDSHGYCECADCSSRRIRKNYLGKTDRSDKYFLWANEIVEGVLKSYPDKWFGCLAYNAVAEPPSQVDVHPRIVPFLTYDRMKWIHPGMEKRGKELTERWAAKASVLGWYDYIYGTPYVVPRIYFHKIAELYKYGFEHGVRAMYAEAYPNWGEGPKLYVVAKLMWNPYRNVDELLDEWYLSAVGKDAAPFLASYFRLWEDFWVNRIKQSRWITLTRSPFAPFFRPSYLDLVSFEDIENSREYLEKALEKAQTPIQKSRVQFLLRTFDYYEASVLSYLGLVKNRRQNGKSIMFYHIMNNRRYSLIEEFASEPLFHTGHPDKDSRLTDYLW